MSEAAQAPALGVGAVYVGMELVETDEAGIVQFGPASLPVDPELLPLLLAEPLLLPEASPPPPSSTAPLLDPVASFSAPLLDPLLLPVPGFPLLLLLQPAKEKQAATETIEEARRMRRSMLVGLGYSMLEA